MKKAVAAVFLVLILLTVSAYYLFPEPMFKLAVNVERRAAGLSQKEIQVDDHQIVYLEGGKGETLLLLHGFGGDKDNWTRFAGYLTKDYHVVIPDIPGFGESSKIKQDVYDADHQLKRIDRFTKELKLEKFHLAGNSMGGAFTAIYSANYPRKVLTAALLDPAGVKSPNKSEVTLLLEKGVNPLFIGSHEDFERMMKMLFVNPPFMPRQFKKVAAAQAIAHSDFNYRILLDLKWTQMKEDGTSVLETLLLPYLPMIQAPVLIIWGDSDKVVDAGGVAVLEKHLKNSRTVIMKDTGHCPMLEKPEETAAAYLAFLKSRH